MKKIDLSTLNNTGELLLEISQFIRREYRDRSSYHRAITRRKDVEQISDYIRFELYAIMNAGFQTSWFLAGEDSGKKALVLKQQLEQLKIAIELPWQIKKSSKNEEWQITISSTGEFVSNGQLEQFKGQLEQINEELEKLKKISNSSGDDKSNTQQNDAELMHQKLELKYRQQVKDFQPFSDARLEILNELEKHIPTDIDRELDGSESLSYKKEIQVYAKKIGAVKFSNQDKEVRTQIDACLHHLFMNFHKQFPERFQDDLTQCNNSVNVLLAKMETLTSESQHLLANTSAIDFRLNPKLEGTYHSLREKLNQQDSLLSCQQQLEAVKEILDNSVGPIIEGKKPIASQEDWLDQLKKQEATLETLQQTVPIAVEAYNQVFTEYEQLIKQVHETQQDYLKGLEACSHVAEGWLVDIEEAIANASYPTINPYKLNFEFDDHIEKEHQKVLKVLAEKYTQLWRQKQAIEGLKSDLEKMQQNVFSDQGITDKQNNLLENLQAKVSQLEIFEQAVPRAIEEYENSSTECRLWIEKLQQYQKSRWQGNLKAYYHLIGVLDSDIEKLAIKINPLEIIYSFDGILNQNGKKYVQGLLDKLLKKQTQLFNHKNKLAVVKENLDTLEKASLNSSEMLLRQDPWPEITLELETLYQAIDLCINECEELDKALKTTTKYKRWIEGIQEYEEIQGEANGILCNTLISELLSDIEKVSINTNPFEMIYAFDGVLNQKAKQSAQSLLDQLIKKQFLLFNQKNKLEAIKVEMGKLEKPVSDWKKIKAKLATIYQEVECCINECNELYQNIKAIPRSNLFYQNESNELDEDTAKLSALIEGFIDTNQQETQDFIDAIDAGLLSNNFMHQETTQRTRNDDKIIEEALQLHKNFADGKSKLDEEIASGIFSREELIEKLISLTDSQLEKLKYSFEHSNVLNFMGEKDKAYLLKMTNKIIRSLQQDNGNQNKVREKLEKILNKLPGPTTDEKVSKVEEVLSTAVMALMSAPPINKEKLHAASEKSKRLLEEAKKALDSSLPVVDKEELTNGSINAHEEVALDDDHSDAVIVEDNAEVAISESPKNRRESIDSVDSGYASAGSSKFSENSTVGPLNKWLKMIAREELSTDELLLITSFANDISDMQKKNINSAYASESIKFFENSTVDPLNKWLSMIAGEELPKNVLLFITDCAKHIYYIKQDHRKEVLEQLESGAEILQRNMQNEKSNFKIETLNILYEGIEDLKEAMQEILGNPLLSAITSKSPKNRRESTDSGYASGPAKSLGKAAVVHQEVLQNQDKEEASQRDADNSSVKVRRRRKRHNPSDDRNRDSGYFSLEVEEKKTRRHKHTRQTTYQDHKDYSSPQVADNKASFFSHIRKSWEESKQAQREKQNSGNFFSSTPEKQHHHYRRKHRDDYSDDNRSTYSGSR